MDTFKIDLLSSRLEGRSFEYEIGDDFFAENGGLINRGTIHTKVDCLSTGAVFKFRICSVGTVVVPCDRCLSDLELRIETDDILSVKLGDDYDDDGECVVVPESGGHIDLAHFIYEFIALSMPMTCCHEPGKCDDAMMQELSRHQTTRSGAEDDGQQDSTPSVGQEARESSGENSVEPVDSRWEALKQFKDKL